MKKTEDQTQNPKVVAAAEEFERAQVNYQEVFGKTMPDGDLDARIALRTEMAMAEVRLKVASKKLEETIAAAVEAA